MPSSVTNKITNLIQIEFVRMLNASLQCCYQSSKISAKTV